MNFYRSVFFFFSLLSQVMLCALAAQVEWGDWKENRDYDRLVAQVLPTRRILEAEAEEEEYGVAGTKKGKGKGKVPEQVNMHHQSLQGMTATRAKEAFLTLIQSWSLYRATIFNVTVSAQTLFLLFFLLSFLQC